MKRWLAAALVPAVARFIGWRICTDLDRIRGFDGKPRAGAAGCAVPLLSAVPPPSGAGVAAGAAPLRRRRRVRANEVLGLGEVREGDVGAWKRHGVFQAANSASSTRRRGEMTSESMMFADGFFRSAVFINP